MLVMWTYAAALVGLNPARNWLVLLIPLPKGSAPGPLKAWLGSAPGVKYWFCQAMNGSTGGPPVQQMDDPSAIFKCTQYSVPVSPNKPGSLSTTRNVHVPWVDLPMRAAKACSGLYEPLYGAPLTSIEPAAESSKIVNVPVQSVAPLPKFSPVLRLLLRDDTSVISVPSGWKRSMVTSPS